MKKFVSVLLMLCLLLSLVPAVSAATTLTTLEQAVVETALAYYYKGPVVQYDSYYIGNGGRTISALLRQTNERTPESSSVDDVHFTVCSAYPWDVYYDVFDDRVIGQQEREDIIPFAGDSFNAILKHMNYTEDQLAYEYSLLCLGRNYSYLAGVHQGKDARAIGYWGPNKWDSKGNVTGLSSIGVDAMEIEKLMRPGDIITNRPYATSTVDGVTTYEANGGHTMMYLGDVFGDGVNYVIHSWGGKYDNNGTVGQKGPDGTVIRGFDLLDNAYSWKENGKYVGRNGSIVLTPYKDILGPGKAYDVAKGYDHSILRPLANKTEADLTPSALFRLDRPGITITKTASLKPYRDLKIGDEITYTVKVENNTLDSVNSTYVAKGYGAVLPQNRKKTYTDLSLTETLPTGTELVSVTGGGKEAGGKITWDLASLAPDKNITVTYTVKVKSGTRLVSPEGVLSASGARGKLPTKELTHEIVPQQLSADKAAAITASSVAASPNALRSGTDSADDVYAAMGYALDLPDGQSFADMIFREVPFVQDAAERYKTDFQLADADALTGQAKTLRQMVVPNFVGGLRLFTADENFVRTNRLRLLQFDHGFLQPGDVLVWLNTGRASNGYYVRSTKVEDTQAFVYLGNDRWGYYKDGTFTVESDPIKYYYGSGTSVKEMASDADSYESNAKAGSKKFSYNKILHQSFLQDVFFLLRPSRVGLTAMTATGNARAVEVQSASGSTWYASLAAAIKASVSGDSVILHEDLQIPDKQVITKSITLDLNGHTVTYAGATPNDTLQLQSCTTTVKNGTVDGSVYVGGEGILTFENMKLMGRDWEYKNTGESIVRIGSALVFSTSAKITLKGVSIASRSPSRTPLQAGNPNTNFSAITVVDDVKILIPKAVTWDYSTVKLGEGVKAYVGQPRSLDGLTKSDAYTCVTLTASPDVYNKTTETHYASLSEAFRTAADGDVLQLLRDVDATDYDEVGQNFDSSTGALKYMYSNKLNKILELDGHTIRDDISGSGTFFCRDDGVSSNGKPTFTIRGGTLNSWAYGISGGQLVVQNMTIRSSSIPIYLSTGGFEGQTALVENSLLMGGFGGKSTGSALANSRGSAIVRNSVLLSNSYQPVQAGTGDAKYSGAVQLEDVQLYTPVYTYNQLGATVLGSHAANRIAPAEGFGLMSAGQLTTYTIDGKAMPFLMDTYGVTNPVATIGSKNYGSVEKALAAAKEGDTVTLQTNASVDAITVPEGVTLDVKDSILTLNVDAILTVAGTVVAESGSVITDDGFVMLEGKGNYLGITVPEGVEGTVFPDPNLQAEVTFAAGSTLQVTGTVPGDYSDVTVYADGKAIPANKTFSLGAVAAKDMGKELTFAVTAESIDGILVGKTQTISLQACAEEVLKSLNWQTNAPAGAALVALLNYGAAAQTYFGHNTNTLANANIGTYQQHLNLDLTSYKKDESTLSGTKPELLLGTSCVLGDELSMKVYVAEGATFDVTVGGETVTGLTGSYVVEDILQYAPTETVTVTVYENGTATAVGTDSLASYLTRLSATQPQLADAILTYAIAVQG